VHLETYLHPCGAIGRIKLKKFLVQYATPVELPQLNFEIDVPTEELLFRTLSNPCTLGIFTATKYISGKKNF
jgi:hypothetical protein